MEELVNFGGTLKTLGDGKVEGLLVAFSDDGKKKDLVGDYFTSKTNFKWEGKEPRPALYGHGRDEVFGLKELGTGWALKKVDSVGVWVETQLNMRDDYERAVYGLAEKGKLGLSSGAAAHMVIRQKDGFIKQWPIAEGSFTPIPAEPRTNVIALKDLTLKAFSEMTSEQKNVFQAGYLLDLASQVFDVAITLKAMGKDGADELMTALAALKQVASMELAEADELPDFDVKETIKYAELHKENKPILKSYRKYMTELRDLMDVEVIDDHSEQVNAVFAKTIETLTEIKQGRPTAPPAVTRQAKTAENRRSISDEQIAADAATVSAIVNKTIQQKMRKQ